MGAEVSANSTPGASLPSSQGPGVCGSQQNHLSGSPPTPRDFPPGAPWSAPCPPPGSGQPRGTERMQCGLRFWGGLSPALHSPHPQPGSNPDRSPSSLLLWSPGTPLGEAPPHRTVKWLQTKQASTEALVLWMGPSRIWQDHGTCCSLRGWGQR